MIGCFNRRQPLLVDAILGNLAFGVPFFWKGASGVVLKGTSPISLQDFRGLLNPNYDGGHRKHPGIQTIIKTMGAHINIAAIAYLRIVIIQVGSTFLLEVKPWGLGGSDPQEGISARGHSVASLKGLGCGPAGWVESASAMPDLPAKSIKGRLFDPKQTPSFGTFCLDVRT